MSERTVGAFLEIELGSRLCDFAIGVISHEIYQACQSSTTTSSSSSTVPTSSTTAAFSALTTSRVDIAASSDLYDVRGSGHGGILL